MAIEEALLSKDLAPSQRKKLRKSLRKAKNLDIGSVYTDAVMLTTQNLSVVRSAIKQGAQKLSRIIWRT
jgi:hypothetical protein